MSFLESGVAPVGYPSGATRPTPSKQESARLHPELLQALLAHIGGGQPGQSGPPAQAPQAPPSPSAAGGQGDANVADHAAQMLLQAVAAVTDPELKAALTSAAATLHKFVAADQKEQHQALAGKMSPRMMAKSYGS